MPYDLCEGKVGLSGIKKLYTTDKQTIKDRSNF